jgi:hypothetical protein
MLTTAVKPPVKTRFGYIAKECVKSLQTVLNESGANASGKALHYTADILCSGGFEIWIRLLWSFLFQNCHISSLRIFIYLQQRTSDLEERLKNIDLEEVYKSVEFQHRVSETVLIIQTLPKQAKITCPKITEETHDPIWLQTVPKPKESEAVNKVWSPQHDQAILKIVGNHILAACETQNVQKALFWLKWILEEDKLVRKQNKGIATLTTQRRAGSGIGKPDKDEIGYYIAAVLAEAYKDLARQKLVRMHEEFQMLIDLWRGKQSRLSYKQRQECLIFMILIIAEVPRWKVPATQPLIKDPVLMGRAVYQSNKFFQEILIKPPVTSILPKDIQQTVIKQKQKKGIKNDSSEDKMRLMDEMVMAFIQH